MHSIYIVWKRLCIITVIKKIMNWTELLLCHIENDLAKNKQKSHTLTETQVMWKALIGPISLYFVCLHIQLILAFLSVPRSQFSRGPEDLGAPPTLRWDSWVVASQVLGSFLFEGELFFNQLIIILLLAVGLGSFLAWRSTGCKHSGELFRELLTREETGWKVNRFVGCSSFRASKDFTSPKSSHLLTSWSPSRTAGILSWMSWRFGEASTVITV